MYIIGYLMFTVKSFVLKNNMLLLYVLMSSVKSGSGNLEKEKNNWEPLMYMTSSKW